MKVVFVSNYLSHHQLSFSLEMAKKVEYYFVATTPFNKERLKTGYADLNEKYPFVIPAYLSSEQKQKAIDLIDSADAVIFGSADESYIANRLKTGKLIFRYTERLYKKPTCPLKFPIRALKFRKLYHGYKNQYLLCASAYTSYDFFRNKAFLDKAYKWGYFPEFREIENPKKQDGSILWAGRQISWKHPEFALLLAKRLKEDGYDNQVKMVGTGEMEDYLKSIAKSQNLDNLTFLGGLSTDKAREEMQKADIFLFTSDREEGWGAVLNEAMNSKCAVVCSHACGSTPYLVRDGENGLIFESENFSDFYKKVRFLIDNPKKREEISNNAYLTIKDEWNAKVACEKLITLINEVLSGNKNPNPFKDGVCSKAESIKDNWYKTND